jgi:hypothetical protein
MSTRAIPFDSFSTPHLKIRLTEDGKLLALDFLSTITSGDRKKASQILARVRSKFPDLLEMSSNEKKLRKIITFANAMKLLLLLPKRTAPLLVRCDVAEVLAEYFAIREVSRSRLPLDQIGKCMELMEKCGPLSKDDLQKFKHAIEDHLLSS